MDIEGPINSLMRNFINIVIEGVKAPAPIAHALRDKLLAETGLTPEQFNSGHCMDFADDLAREHRDLFEEIEMANLFNHDYEAGEDSDDATGFDLDMVKKLFPVMEPPAGWTWDDLFQAVPTGTHVWAYCHSDHHSYDIEAPDGVLNPLDLPFFQRLIHHYDAEVKASHDKAA